MLQSAARRRDELGRACKDLPTSYLKPGRWLAAAMYRLGDLDDSSARTFGSDSVGILKSPGDLWKFASFFSNLSESSELPRPELLT